MSGDLIERVSGALSRLRGRSIQELRTRGTQAARSWLEQRVPAPSIDDDRVFRATLAPHLRELAAPGDAGALRERFRQGMDGRFLAAFDDRAATVQALRTRWPASDTGLLGEADEIRAGRFDLLGYRGLSFGTPIDWHLDPVAGRRAPLVHWSRVPYLDAATVGDHKVVWELNRHQYFITLGRAYWATGDERYAETIAQHLVSWMDENPPKLGINWASSLEVAFRAISWVWVLSFLRESPALTPRLYRRMLVFLDLHGRHLARYLSTYFSPNTHLTGEALGLYVLGLSLPSLAAADQFRRIGRQVLVEQLPLQVRSDGVYVEQTPYYQRYTLDFYLFALALADQSDGALREAVAPRLSAAAEHLMYLMRPDRSWPLIGDDDGGQLLPFRGRAPNDYRPTLAAAAATFGRGDLAACAGLVPEEVLWLLGSDGVRRFDELERRYPSSTSRAFPQGGFYVMRDGWDTGSDYAVVDAGDHGYLNAGHAHADALGIDLALSGVPLFVDPGTGSYTADPTARDYYRGGAVHNTVTVDGRSSSEPGPSAFRWTTMARVTSRQWLSASQFDLFHGTHDGFGRLPSPARHERSVLFLKQRYWIVRDRIDSEGPHQVAVHFHCSPSIVAEQEGATAVRLLSPEGSLDARLVVAEADGTIRLTEERCSPVYGGEVPTRGVTFECRSLGAREIVTIVARESVEVRRLGTDVIEIVTSDTRDLLLGAGEREGVCTDATWGWVRRSRATGRATELVLVDASRCTVDGAEVVPAGPRVAFVEGRLGDHGWDLRTGPEAAEAR